MDAGIVRLALRRVLHLVIVVLGVYTALFVLLRLSGDPALLYVSEDAGPARVVIASVNEPAASRIESALRAQAALRVIRFGRDRWW